MNTIRNLLLATIGLAALAIFSQPVQAQQRADAAISLISLTSITNNTTVTLTNIVMDVRKQAKVALQTKFKAVDATTSNVVFVVTRSVDGTTYETTGTSITVAANGTNDVVTVTEVDCKGARYVKLHSIQNTDGTIGLGATSAQYALKIGAE